MIASVPTWVEVPVWTVMGLTFALAVGWEAGKGLLDRWLAHRAELHRHQVDQVVAEALEGHVAQVKRLLDEMVLDVNARQNSEAG